MKGKISSCHGILAAIFATLWIFTSSATADIPKIEWYKHVFSTPGGFYFYYPTNEIAWDQTKRIPGSIATNFSQKSYISALQEKTLDYVWSKRCTKKASVVRLTSTMHIPGPPAEMYLSLSRFSNRVKNPIRWMQVKINGVTVTGRTKGLKNLRVDKLVNLSYAMNPIKVEITAKKDETTWRCNGSGNSGSLGVAAEVWGRAESDLKAELAYLIPGNDELGEYFDIGFQITNLGPSDHPSVYSSNPAISYGSSFSFTLVSQAIRIMDIGLGDSVLSNNAEFKASCSKMPASTAKGDGFYFYCQIPHLAPGQSEIAALKWRTEKLICPGSPPRPYTAGLHVFGLFDPVSSNGDVNSSDSAAVKCPT